MEIFIQFPHYGNFLLHKLKIAAETIEGKKLFPEIRYAYSFRLTFSFPSEWHLLGILTKDDSSINDTTCPAYARTLQFCSVLLSNKPYRKSRCTISSVKWLHLYSFRILRNIVKNPWNNNFLLSHSQSLFDILRNVIFVFYSIP